MRRSGALRRTCWTSWQRTGVSGCHRNVLALDAFLAAATVALKTTGKNCILNMYDVEKDKDKQRWLRVLGEGFGERCIFKEMGDMADTHAW